MTTQEPQLMVLMFARVHEALGVIEDSLKSCGIWKEDDERAFSHALHADPEKIVRYAGQPMADYLRCAAQLGWKRV